MKNGKLCVALVGMSFGAEFIPIYLHHPQVERLILVDSNEKQLLAMADKFLLNDYTASYEDVLNDPEVDAVHLVVPPALHAPMSIQALNAGKHCSCTIPMGMSMKELEDIFEWSQLLSEKPVVFTMEQNDDVSARGSRIFCDRPEVPDYNHLLPEEIRRFTRQTVYDESNPHLAFLQGGGHGGSHPHLVNEFVQCIVEDRTPFPSDIDGAYWTSVGLLAHESAMEGGTVKTVPVFENL